MTPPRPVWPRDPRTPDRPIAIGAPIALRCAHTGWAITGALMAISGIAGDGTYTRAVAVVTPPDGAPIPVVVHADGRVTRRDVDPPTPTPRSDAAARTLAA